MAFILKLPCLEVILSSFPSTIIDMCDSSDSIMRMQDWKFLLSLWKSFFSGCDAPCTEDGEIEPKSNSPYRYTQSKVTTLVLHSIHSIDVPAHIHGHSITVRAVWHPGNLMTRLHSKKVVCLRNMGVEWSSSYSCDWLRSDVSSHIVTWKADLFQLVCTWG